MQAILICSRFEPNVCKTRHADRGWGRRVQCMTHGIFDALSDLFEDRLAHSRIIPDQIKDARLEGNIEARHLRGRVRLEPMNERPTQFAYPFFPLLRFESL